MGKSFFLSIIYFIVLCINLHSQTLDNKRIILKTDKLEYYSFDTVELSIKNISKDTLYFYKKFITYESLELERKKEQNWILIDIKSPIEGKMVVEPFVPGEIIFFDWQQIINKKGEKTIRGKYRFKLNYWEKIDIPYPIKSKERDNNIKNSYREYITSYSNEIILK